MVTGENTTQQGVGASRRAPLEQGKPVMMVYYSEDFTWRGFVHPYDITTEMPSKKKTVERLKEIKKYQLIEKCKQF